MDGLRALHNLVLLFKPHVVCKVKCRDDSYIYLLFHVFRVNIFIVSTMCFIVTWVLSSVARTGTCFSYVLMGVNVT